MITQNRTSFSEELCLTQICNGNGPELGADFRTHEEDVGDPEADRY
jgi:hypothetical protein